MSNELFNLKGKVALVSGASRGLGKGMAAALAKAGADVIISSRSQEALEVTAREIKEATSSKVYPVSCDIRDMHSIDNLIKKSVMKFGKIDILVNGAGMNIRKPIIEVTESDWDTLMGVNLKGGFFLCKAAAEVMIKQGNGKIINIASTASTVGFNNICMYCASKGAVLQMTKAMALEWAKYNINVNAIGPGSYKTEMTKVLYEDEEKHKGLLSRIPMGRTGVPEDLAGAVVFLGSEASNYITGQIIYVDGGWTAG